MLRRVLALTIPLALPSLAHAGALNSWGTPAGAGVFGINPYLYVYPYDSANLYGIVYAQYGISDPVDLIAGISGYTGDDWGGTGGDVFEIMPRYFFSDSMGVAAHGLISLYEGGGTELGPEIHALWSNDYVDLNWNLGWLAWLGEGGADTGRFDLLLSPEHYITDSFSFYFEADLRYYPTDDLFEAQVIPGISWSFQELHYFSLGVQFPMTDTYDAESAIAPGLWYYTSFGGADE